MKTEPNVPESCNGSEEVLDENWQADRRTAKLMLEIAELVRRNEELSAQNTEMGKRATELAIAYSELAFQNEEKGKRAAELVVANDELAFQNREKKKRAAEFVLAGVELDFQAEEKDKRAAELVVANQELAFQNEEKGKRAAELAVANDELAFQKGEKKKRAAERVLAEVELDFQAEEKDKRAAELVVANQELAYQNEEKGKRAAELVVANDELAFQNGEKKKRAAERMLAEVELDYQAEEKDKRAAELVIANQELAFQNVQKEKQAAALVIANDDLRKAQDLAHELNEELELRVTERTEQLNAANRDLESFSYSVSHDLRAPLRGIHGYARMFLEDFGPQLQPDAQRLLNKIMENASMMGHLIDDLLAFSRLGRKELEKTKMPMDEMVANLCASITAENSEREICFKIDPLAEARGDRVVIKQVWENLIQNAVKYCKLKETTLIEIGCTIGHEDIVYHIKDNGIGFDMRYAKKMFGVFQRLHADSTFEGTGVGLAIVHRIVAKHGGRVWGEGKLNEGARFSFSLPN